MKTVSVSGLIFPTLISFNILTNPLSALMIQKVVDKKSSYLDLFDGMAFSRRKFDLLSFSNIVLRMQERYWNPYPQAATDKSRRKIQSEKNNEYHLAFTHK